MEINKIFSDAGTYGLVGQTTKKQPEKAEPVESLVVKDERLTESSSEKLIRLVLEMNQNNQSQDSTEYGDLKKGSFVDKYA
ncbi:MAG TPA: hypothetical protein PL041_07030 [Melioribacteraceae bacterium]|nr:hypothetical protein [Melioribacteraceae bacterium]